ncbi:sensor histidine kinase [Pseudoalteromonas sp. T1lg65]|uniref:sensor histidine kinase n=1 Tax=Pseudoalteromonas sp. T1lg65 TaxID=2077101 RepID=UPI003F7ACED2
MGRVTDNKLTALLSFVSPYVAFVLLYTWLTFDALTWRNTLPSLTGATFLLGPILICKFQSMTKTQMSTTKLLWWLVGFVGLPLVHLTLQYNAREYAAIFQQNATFFISLFAVELGLLAKRFIVPVTFSTLKQFLTLDRILLAIVVFFSVLWALVFNSIDDPMQNQPIHILIDLKRNFLRFDAFFIYFVQFLIIYGCGYGIYWLNHHVFIDKVMARHGFFYYLVSAAIFLLLCSPVLSQLLLLLPINQNVEFTLLPSGNQDPFDTWNLRIAFLIMAFSLPIILVFKWQQQSAELAELTQKSTQAELKWLQQQINPHFLFNTLNNLYSLVLTKSPQAPDAVLQLANLLRFVVYKGGQNRVSVQEELGYLKDYLALQQLRVSHKATIEVDIDPNLASQSQLSIAPLLIVVLLENAFKHGIDVSNQSCWLRFSMHLIDNELAIICENSVPESTSHISNKDEQQGGVGLENLRRRLALAYTDKHTLKTQQSDYKFSASLAIKLDANE